jgi:hypothetical protein
MMPRLRFRAVSESPGPTPRPRLTPWLAAIGVLAVAVVAFAAVQVFEDDDDGGGGRPTTTFAEVAPAPTTTPVPTSPQLTLTDSVPATTPGGPEPPEPGRLAVGDRDLFPALSGSLASFANQQVEGERVTVIEVNSTSSFWVGRSRDQRLLVVLNLKGQPFPQLSEGQIVSLVGQIRPNDGNYGETDAPGAALLERQAHHALVSVFDLKLS